MPQPPADDRRDNVRRLSDKLPVGLIPGGLEEEPEEPAVDPVDYPGTLRALADALDAELRLERIEHARTVEQLREQRDWAFVNRDTHYQRVLQLEAENAELRRQLAELHTQR